MPPTRPSFSGDSGGEKPAGDLPAAETLFEFAANIVKHEPSVDEFDALVMVCNLIPAGDPAETDISFTSPVLEAVCRLAAEAIGAEPEGMLRAGVREALAEFEERV